MIRCNLFKSHVARPLIDIILNDGIYSWSFTLFHPNHLQILVKGDTMTINGWLFYIFHAVTNFTTIKSKHNIQYIGNIPLKI